jgi:hypothetical protein
MEPSFAALLIFVSFLSLFCVAYFAPRFDRPIYFASVVVTAWCVTLYILRIRGLLS